VKDKRRREKAGKNKAAEKEKHLKPSRIIALGRAWVSGNNLFSLFSIGQQFRRCRRRVKSNYP
jgi:hypothetical protein